LKKFLLITFFLFGFIEQSYTEDIRDLEIEGMSIGNNLLDFYNEETIKKNTKDYYKYKKNFPFVAIEIENHRLFENYDGVQFHVKKNDTNYEIQGISGYIYCKNNINNCYKQAKKIENDFLKIFKNLKVRRVDFNHEGDPSKKSKVKGIYFTFLNGDVISINIYDWSKEIGFNDNFDVSIDTKDLYRAFSSRG